MFLGLMERAHREEDRRPVALCLNLHRGPRIGVQRLDVVDCCPLDRARFIALSERGVARCAALHWKFR